MKKRLTLLIVLLIFGFAGFAQQYGNEWINYSQYYFKIYVSQDGIYRIPYSTLQNAGVFSYGQIDPRSLQLFCGGQEQYIYIHGENDGIFDANDYIEFYGKRNTGWYDQVLYKNANDHTNPNYSLFNDSSAYFLTWNSSISNRRLTPENDVNFSSYTAASWFYKVVREDYTSKYLGGKPGSYGITDPEFTAGEGWVDNAFNLGTSPSPNPKDLATPNRYASGPDADVLIAVVSASDYAPLPIDHHLRIQFSGTLIDTTYGGYQLLRFHRTVPAFQINSTTSFNFASIDDLGSGADRNAVAYIQVKYPHSPTADNESKFRLFIPDGPQAKTYLNLTGLNANAGDSVRFFDLTNHKRIRTSWDGTNLQVLVPNSTGEEECYFTSDAQINTVTRIVQVGTNNQFINYKTIADNIRADYYIITHKNLLSTAQQYQTYRNATGYSALLVDVDDLWDQYAYGILKNPLAIRNFLRSAYLTYTEQPDYLFLIGKGYRAGHEGVFPTFRKSTTYWNQTLIPAFGNPPSDLLFSNHITDSLYRPALATGRLAARNNAHVSLYLDKVQQYETAQLNPQEWMKNVLHFGGGTSLAEQNIYKGYLEIYEQIIEDTLFGGTVQTFLKTTSDPIQINQSDSLKQIINNGVSLMTFFGHAAGIGFDQSIDNPSEYNNLGKYPFLLANSCYAGDIFLDTPVSSEEFMLIENKGTIGYLASISLGIPPELHAYSHEFYKNISYLNYGEPVGKCIQQTIATIQDADLETKSTCLELLLHGDPAIRINFAELPDYMITASNVYFDPPSVTTEVDSFYIHVISTNIGMAINDSFNVWVERVMPDGVTQSTHYRRIKATFFKDTIAFKLPVDLANGVGLNKFTVTLDYNNEIVELSELNNSTEVTLLIKSSDITPVWPYKYAVVPDIPLTLKASTGNPFAPSTAYKFEMDTTDEFNSSVKQEMVVTQAGGVVTWTPNFPILTDSIVYFWRVSPDSASNGFWNWRESSFQYIDGKHGWGQAHFFQFKNDNYQYVKYNRGMRKFEFVNDIKAIDCQTGYYPYIPWTEEFYNINGSRMYTFADLTDVGNGMIVAVMDPISATPWYRYNILGDVRWGFEFSSTDTNALVAMGDFIDSIPNGYYVLAYSHRNHLAENNGWPENTYQAYESIGSGNIRNLQNTRPYIIFGRKGNAPGTANEVTGMNITDIINLEDSIITSWNQGYVLSEMIGPATQWGSLHWRQRTWEGVPSDVVSLSVIGFTPSGLSDTVISDLPPDSADILNLWQRIDANVYPYLKLVAIMADDSLHTAAQMIRWQVLFEGAPETALNPTRHFYFYNDTVQEGERIYFSTATENIGQYDMDSLLIKYWIIDQARNIHPLGSFRHRTHPVADVLIDSVDFSTTGLVGLNSLWIEVNPENDQLEQYHFNNLGEVYFYVGKDITNPILDVTFDGVHIMDGDIVSAKPEINIMLKDENLFLMLNEVSDTSHFKVWIIPPGGTSPERIYFISGGIENLQFVPATGSENRSHILYRPSFMEDGTYTLLVQAEDKSQNESGDYDYEISFEVINKPSITAVMNWPNPFSTATHFVFTLTGSEVPSFFMIQIMTVTGKVVKEITREELGNIHVGRNITDYAWDGTDMYGDRLANGVYLYRVITRLGEDEIEHKNTAADQYFTKEFGKMYLMR